MLGLFPFLSSYLVRLGADPATAGAILAAYSAANILGNATGGWLADRGGRAWPVRAGLAGTAGSFVLYAVPRLELVALAHALHGFMAGMATPAAFAWVGDRGRRSGQGRAMGRTGAAIALAAVLAPALGGVLAQRAGPDRVFLILGVMTVVALARAWRLGDVAETEAAGAGDGGSPSSGRAPLAALATPPLLTAYAAALVTQAAFGLLIWLLPLQAQQGGIGSGAAGALMGLLGAVAGLWMGLGGSLADRLDRPTIVGAGLVGLMVGQALLAGAVEPARFWARGMAGAAIFGTGFGTTFPAAAAMVAEATASSQRGRAFSLFSIAFSLGAMASPAAGGLLVRQGWLVVPGVDGGSAAWWQTPYVLGVVAAAALALVTSWPRRPGWSGLISRRIDT